MRYDINPAKHAEGISLCKAKYHIVRYIANPQGFISQIKFNTMY